MAARRAAATPFQFGRARSRSESSVLRARDEQGFLHRTVTSLDSHGLGSRLGRDPASIVRTADRYTQFTVFILRASVG
jgi:hypothetical protein